MYFLPLLFVISTFVLQIFYNQLFVELRSIPSAAKIQDSSGVGEFFLGLCECSTVRSWILCSDQLMRRRKSDCIFTEAVPTANTSARVHRRLCDVTLLTKYAQPCNCSIPMANQRLYRTEGFHQFINDFSSN